MQALSEHTAGYFPTHAPIGPAFHSFPNKKMEIVNDLK